MDDSNRFIQFGEVCRIMAIAPQTGYNKVHKGTFPIKLTKQGNRLYATARDVARYIEHGPARSGRKRRKVTI